MDIELMKIYNEKVNRILPNINDSDNMLIEVILVSDMDYFLDRDIKSIIDDLLDFQEQYRDVYFDKTYHNSYSCGRFILLGTRNETDEEKTKRKKYETKLVELAKKKQKEEYERLKRAIENERI